MTAKLRQLFVLPPNNQNPHLASSTLFRPPSSIALNQQKLHLDSDTHPDSDKNNSCCSRRTLPRDETRRNETETKTNESLFLTVPVIAQREREQNKAMSAPEESAAQRSARLRRERREAKIRDGGAERLDKITSMSGRTPASGMFFILFYSIIFFILPALST